MRMAICILALGLSTTVAHAQFGGGTGEPNDPYQIWTAQQMNAIGADPNLWDKHFVLMADLDLSAYDGQDGREAFNIIGGLGGGRSGNSVIPFRGSFDGNGHTIANFSFVSSDARFLGLFRGIADPNTEIRNLTLICPTLDASTATDVGALVGCIAYGASISNCHVEDGVVLGTDNVGSLVGYCDGGSITECHATGIVIGNNYIGGLVGDFDDWHTGISRCYATATIIGNEYVGGLAGRGRATNCYATSTVFGNNYVGGLVGINKNLQNCYAAGTVVANVPSNEDVFVGGLTGYYDFWYDDIEIVNCFYDFQISGALTCSAGVGKMTAQMQSSTTFLAWGQGDNAGVWTIDEGHDYPRLAWEGHPGIPLETTSFSDIVAGSGTPDDPYLIETAQQLAILATSPEQWDCHFELTADLDLAGAALPNIGTSESPFTGVFDGNGHTLSGYRNAASDPECTGLFGYAGYGSRSGRERVVIKDLGLIEPIVNGGICDNTAALVGHFVAGIITDCYVEGGFVLGGETSGGLVGRNYGTIRDCYASTSVLGNDVAGGLVGNNQYGEIINCYSTGFVLRQGNAGGLVGFGEEGEVIESFWDIETSDQATSNGGEGRTTAQLHDPNTFIAAGWDLFGGSDGPDDMWTMDGESGYPVLWWQVPSPEYDIFSGGDGSAEAPYLIASAEQLNSIGCNPRLMQRHFRLTADVNLEDIDFFPIGSIASPFNGIFDGDFRTVSNLTQIQTRNRYIGLFGYVSGSQAAIMNLRLISPDIGVEENSYVGALAGNVEAGSITNCCASDGRVTGYSYVGGLVGNNHGVITECCVRSITVSGQYDIGGLVGDTGPLTSRTISEGGVIVNSYATGAVSGHSYIGGLAGRGGPELFAACYSATLVTATQWGGGLIGGTYPLGSNDSFWDIDASGLSISEAGLGLTTAEMQMIGTFLDAGWDFVGESDNGTEDIWWMPEDDYPRLWWE